jgi:hypothetical protein
MGINLNSMIPALGQNPLKQLNKKMPKWAESGYGSG